jgi:murein DD-endopeptidase MepM/ murein hydrolase activator NlpD
MEENLPEPKKSRRTLKIIAVVVFVFFLLIAWVYRYTYNYITNFPETNPDKTLEIEERVATFFEKITMPIKIARLSSQEADKELLMPVYGHRISEIADTWQAPRDEGRVHEGQDIFANRGTPIFSATKGFVIRITQDSLGGNSVYVLGSGGVRYYYTHLDRFADGLTVGDEVTTDSVIGFVGNTGNAETTPSHLHFGVYVDQEPIDPLPLLINR